jgi:4'-phosphopantetheinyl transferase
MEKKNNIAPDLRYRIYPVILSVPSQNQGLKGRERVKTLSWLARQALEICARKCRLQLGALTKDAQGVPQPFDGHYWSLTHKPSFVGAVISLQKTGIDIEEIRSISDAMYKRVAGDKEWQLGGSRSQELFFRFWTAKEAALKAEGLGMAGLSKCIITRILGRTHLELVCQGNHYLIEHMYVKDHIASVVKNQLESQWTIPAGNTIPEIV